MVRNSSSVVASHMSGLIGSKRPVNSVAPAPNVGPAYKRSNVGSSSSSSVNRRTNNPVMGQQYPQPINTTRINNNNGYVAQNYHHNGLVMPIEGYINPFSGQSSVYRGVTRYPGHFEAVVCDNCGVAGKPETVYLGAYYREREAARAYDLAALKLYGQLAILNFPLSNYGNEVEMMKYIPKSEYLVTIRRMSPGCYGDRTSCYHGVSRILGTQKWQATIPNPDAAGSIINLGAFDTEHDAAKACDFATIKIQGNAAITNFSLSTYNVAAICNSNYLVVGSGGAKCVTLQTGANNAVTWTPSNLWVTQNGVNNAVTWTSSNHMNRPIQQNQETVDRATLGLDASRCTGGLEDMIKGFKFAEPVSGQNPTRWRLEEVKKFLEIETDESSDTNKQVKGDKNPSQLPTTTTTTPLNEFIKDMAEFIKANPSFPTENSSLVSDITTLPLDESNYCGGAEDQTKTLFDEIDELFNLGSDDEPVMRTDPGSHSLSDMNNLLPIDEIALLDWDDVASDDWSDIDGDEELPSSSNNIEIPNAEMELGTQVGG